jgi:hypothetical protein
MGGHRDPDIYHQSLPDILNVFLVLYLPNFRLRTDFNSSTYYQLPICVYLCVGASLLRLQLYLRILCKRFPHLALLTCRFPYPFNPHDVLLRAVFITCANRTSNSHETPYPHFRLHAHSVVSAKSCNKL